MESHSNLTSYGVLSSLEVFSNYMEMKIYNPMSRYKIWILKTHSSVGKKKKNPIAAGIILLDILRYIFDRVQV